MTAIDLKAKFNENLHVDILSIKLINNNKLFRDEIENEFLLKKPKFLKIKKHN